MTFCSDLITKIRKNIEIKNLSNQEINSLRKNKENTKEKKEDPKLDGGTKIKDKEDKKLYKSAVKGKIAKKQVRTSGAKVGKSSKKK